MREKNARMTTAQFAGLHGVNKRTLHYYDSIGLFSPEEKGENQYRYYGAAQSLDFEYIRMLKELNMSIEEILEYRKSPGSRQFLALAEQKLEEIDWEIRKLKQTRRVLEEKKAQALLCEEVGEEAIRLEYCREEKILVLPYDFAEDDMVQPFLEAKKVWSVKQIRMGLGGVLSLEKVRGGRFEAYDGIYTPALEEGGREPCVIKPGGTYLCGYQKGTWDKLPAMYEKMLNYAKERDLTLDGYAYEMGMNEFMIADPEAYLTKIMIRAKEKRGGT